MRILLVSPFHGGSHQAWAEGLQAHCPADFELLTLPDRFWKWRMHGGSVTLAERFNRSGPVPDLILATDMLDLSHFLALTRRKTCYIPAVLYCHENQLTYPMPQNIMGNRLPERVEEIDRHYPFINLTSMLAADRVIFNSAYHQEEFLKALPAYLGQFPDYRLSNAIAEISSKSSVIYPGINIENPNTPAEQTCGSPLILWNQRIEYDKNPGEFFSALVELKDEGYEFRLAVCGEQYTQRPEEVDSYLDMLKPELVHMGYADPGTYQELLRRADIVLSTAIHEFFGISILEAILNRTYPVLPGRLSYPELIPPEFHEFCLYKNRGEMLGLLKKALRNQAHSAEMAGELRLAIGDRFCWETLARQYEDFFEETARNHTHRK